MSRRQAREIALQALYQLELNPVGETEADRETVALDAALGECEQRISERTRTYAQGLVAGTRQHGEEIDALIASCSRGWTLARMAAVDRNILRVAAYEMKFADEPLTPSIAIDEAVELAKKYGADDSGKFVNGVLGAM